MLWILAIWLMYLWWKLQVSQFGSNDVQEDHESRTTSLPGHYRKGDLDIIERENFASVPCKLFQTLSGILVQMFLGWCRAIDCYSFKKLDVRVSLYPSFCFVLLACIKFHQVFRNRMMQIWLLGVQNFHCVISHLKRILRWHFPHPLIVEVGDP